MILQNYYNNFWIYQSNDDFHISYLTTLLNQIFRLPDHLFVICGLRFGLLLQLHFLLALLNHYLVSLFILSNLYFIINFYFCQCQLFILLVLIQFWYSFICLNLIFFNCRLIKVFFLFILFKLLSYYRLFMFILYFMYMPFYLFIRFKLQFYYQLFNLNFIINSMDLFQNFLITPINVIVHFLN